MAICDDGEMRPAILATGNMRDIHRPPFIVRIGTTHPARTRDRGVDDR